jgi:hypothetical protein
MKQMFFITAVILSILPLNVLAGSTDKFYIVCAPVASETNAGGDAIAAYLSRTFTIFNEEPAVVELFTDRDRVEYRKWDVIEFQDEFIEILHNKKNPTHKIIINRLSGYAESYGIPERTVDTTPIPEGFTEDVPVFKLIEVLNCRKASPIF